MRLTRLAVAAAVLAVLLPTSSAVAAPTGPAPTGPALAAVDIAFDGFCDGLHLNLPSLGEPGTASTVDGHQTGCESGGVFGEAKPNVHGSYGVSQGAEFLTLPSSGALTVVRKDHTWVHYGHAGDTMVEINSGTWSRGKPALGGAAASSYDTTAPGATSGHETVSPLRVREITFDGHCDGMHLVAPSAGLLTARSIDGHLTGCESAGLIGRRTKIGATVESPVGNPAGSAAGSPAGTAGVAAAPWEQARIVQFHTQEWVQTAIFRDHTWVHYRIDGDLITVLNSGTWSRGVPGAADLAAAPSTTFAATPRT